MFDPAKKKMPVGEKLSVAPLLMPSTFCKRPELATSWVTDIELPVMSSVPPLNFTMVVGVALSPCMRLPAMESVPPLRRSEAVLPQSPMMASPVSTTLAEPATTNDEPLLLVPSETATCSSPTVSEPPEMVAVLAPPPEVVL